jgi:hypothetical protein
MARWIVAIDPELVGAGAAVAPGHAHAAEAQTRDLEPLASQDAIFFMRIPLSTGA